MNELTTTRFGKLQGNTEACQRVIIAELTMARDLALQEAQAKLEAFMCEMEDEEKRNRFVEARAKYRAEQRAYTEMLRKRGEEFARKQREEEASRERARLQIEHKRAEEERARIERESRFCHRVSVFVMGLARSLKF